MTESPIQTKITFMHHKRPNDSDRLRGRSLSQQQRLSKVLSPSLSLEADQIGGSILVFLNPKNNEKVVTVLRLPQQNNRSSWLVDLKIRFCGALQHYSQE
mmetsp:Transcript_108517/g.215490  ORF Transcript_108517/g.215490 Transcript_108517/m.215490 type:complete len:100 (+) Transcript_108517:203-502(+)